MLFQIKMNGGLSKLGVVLVIIFAISLLAIFAQISYALWRRRAFRRRTTSIGGGGGGEELSRHCLPESGFSTIAPSKELLYFFCIRPQYRLDRSSLTANSLNSETNSNHESDVEIIDVDLLKIHGAFGPPRFLFTIKEEEKEGMESPAKITPYPAEPENEMKIKTVGDENRSQACLDAECLRAAVEAAEEENEIEMDDDHSVDIDATPFSTPCASPVYFTPTASPEHAAVNGRSTGETLIITCST